MNFSILLLLTICSVDVITTQECLAYGRQCRDGRDGEDGRNGINGKNGKNGLNGKDGINGIDGKDAIDGKAGKDGLNGMDGINGIDGKDGVNGKDGLNGKDGGNGTDGKNGIDGKDGTDGLNGMDGINGTDGKDGITGENGKDGLNGKDGVNGVDGRDGIDGKDGKFGKDGLNGRDAFRKNWKECTWTNTVEGNDGLIKKCEFKKCSNATSMNVIVSTNLRLFDCYDCCKRWYVTFNGSECSTPVPIEGVVYTLKAYRAQDTMRPHVIRGHCQNITSGTVSVEFRYGNCPYYGDAKALTGFNSSSRMFIEEVDQPQE